MKLTKVVIRAVIIIAALFGGRSLLAQQTIQWLPLLINTTQNPDILLSPNSSGSNPGGTWLVTNLACYGDVLVTQTFPTNVVDFVDMYGENVPNAETTFINGGTGGFNWGSMGNFNFGNTFAVRENYTLNFYFLSGQPLYASLVLLVDGLASNTTATVSQSVIFRGEYDLSTSAYTAITNQPYNVATATGSTNAGTIGTVIGSYYNADHQGDGFNTGYGIFQPIGVLQTTSLPTGSGRGFPSSPPTVPYLSLAVSQESGDGIGFSVGYICFTNVCTNNCIAIYDPNDIVTTTCSNCAEVNFEAAALDTCCSSVALSYNPPPGSCFPVGINTVQVTATDTCGHTNNCSFTVTVLQNTNPPVVTSSPTNVIICVPTPTGCGPMPDVTSEVEATAAIPGAAVTITQNIPAGASICTNTNVIITVSDACGEATNYTLPCILTNCCLSIDCSNIVEETCSNSMPVFFSVTAQDNCCSNCLLTVISTPASGYNFPVGTTTVTNTAADSGGNSNYCTFTVTVVPGTEEPVFGCLTPPVNLVPNGDFETYTNCPNYYSQLDFAVPWFPPSLGTPDYFNACCPAIDPVSTPDNSFGSMVPHSGAGYAGEYAYYGVSIPDYREYIEVPLTSTLAAGTSYRISFYVCLADTSSYAVDNIGAYLSAGALDNYTTDGPFPVVPQVRNPLGYPVTSTNSWTLISGTYTAVGGEDHLTIGNFSDDVLTLVHSVHVKSGTSYSYYYIDDVSVSNLCGCVPDKTVYDGSTWTFDTPTAYDPATGASVNVTVLSTLTNGNCPLVATRTWVAANSCGSNTCSQTVTVPGTPQILCTNIMISSCVSNQVFYVPTVVDPCCSNVPVTCDPPSGTWFGLGTTTVLCTATDCLGVVATSAFTVTIASSSVSQTNIVLTCCTNLPVYYSPAVTECCSNWNLYVFPPSGSTFYVGTTTLVTYIVSDSCGGTNMGTFAVTMLQGTNCTTCFPQILCTNIIISSCVSNQVFYAPTVMNSCCSNDVVTCDPPSGSWFGIGTTEVFCLTTNCQGVVGTGSFTVTIAGSTVSQTNIVVTSCTNLPVDYSPTFTDCCSNWNFDLFPPSGSTFDVGTTNMVTYVLSDICGSTNIGTFTVTVLRGTNCANCLPPVFGCLTPPVNFVPNGGFETYSSCPTGPSEISLATPWFQPTGGTPDYFNSCAPSSSGVSTPANFVGSVAPHSGNGYAGGTAYTVNGGSYGSREYIEVPLASPLVASESYQVSFYVSLSESMYGIDSMGAYFSAGPLEDSSTWNALAVTPQVRNPPGNFLTSIGSWTLVSGSFTAAGGENYMTIGNFLDDGDTLAARSSAPEIGSSYGSYYYIDDVSVSNMCGCPADKVVYATLPWTFDRPTAYDPNTGASVNVTVLSTVTNGPCPLTITQTWVATNSCGSNTCSQTVTVLEAPQILCTNITIESCVATQLFYNPSAVDPCCPNVLVGCDPPSGSLFNEGTTTVTCLATNCLGVIGFTNFTVTVSPLPNPPFPIQTNIVVTSCTNVAVFYSNLALTNSECCSNWLIGYSEPSGGIFDVGTETTVTYAIGSTCLGTNYADFTVTVLPGESCTNCVQIDCPTNISVTTCSNCATVNFTVTATNLCCPEPVPLTYSPLQPGSCFPVGTTVEVVSGKDICHNITNTCTFYVTVTENPCPPIISVGPTNFILCAGASGCVPMPDEVHATPNFFVLDNTGVSGGLSASGTESLPQATLNDPHWTLVSVPVLPPASPLEFGTNTQLQINTLPQWLSPDTLAAWIAPANDGSNDAPEGDYDYRTTFVLPADGTFTISAQVTADDYVSDVLANGLSTGVATTNGNSATQWNPITITATGVAGTNTLDFIVHNNPTIGNNPPTDNMDSPSGLLVEFNGITIQPAQGQTEPYLPYNPAAVQATNCDGSPAPGWQSIPAGTILCGNTNITFVFTNPCGDTTSYTATVTVENCCTPPPSYMVLWLTFDETVGNICLNSAGGNAGIRYAGSVMSRNTNGPSHNVGEYVNNSLCFNGLDDMVLVPDYPAIDFATNNFSIDAWVKWNGTGDAVQVLADHRTQSGGNYYGYEWFLDNGKPGLQLGTGPYANFVSPNAIPANVWTHLAVTVQRGSASGVKFYVNGALSDFFDDTHVTGSIALRPIQYLAVGNLEPSLGGSSPFNGCMDELELFARVLLPYEVADIYGAFHAGKCRPTCSVPAVSTLCLGVNTVTVPVEVCNTGSTTQFLTVNFAGLSWIQAGGSPATNGPSIFSSPTYVVLPPNTCTNFNVTITKPPGLNLANVAYYEMVIMDPLGQKFSSIGKIQEIDSVWCGAIHIQNATNILISSGPVNIGFMVNNPTGVSYPLNSQVVVVDGNLNPETNAVSLNGLAPGTPVTNQFILPANGSTPVSVNVSYVGPQPSTPYYLVLYLNVRYDGVSIPVASAGFAQVIPPTVGPPLSVSVTNGQAVITWDAENTGWTLISTTNLGSTNWIPVNLPVLPQPDGSQGVSQPMTNNAQFFQLLNPGSP